MLPLLRVTFIAVLVLIVMFCEVNLSESEEYLKRRNYLLSKEKVMFSGGQINLTEKEKAVNEIFLREKKNELAIAHEDTLRFLPARHFFQAKEDIEKSQVFSMLKKMPKGACLHTHLTAAVSVDFIIRNITYRENIYGCSSNGVFKLKFLLSPDEDLLCNWKSLTEYRSEDPKFDVWLRKQLSLEVDDPLKKYPDVKTVWQHFKKIFTTVYDMLSYKPVFKQYVYELLKELYDDNIMYTELRGTVMPLYDLSGTVYRTKDFFDIFIEAVEDFKKKHPRFLGVRYIHSIYRGVAQDVLKTGLDELIKLQKLYPQFIAGFDFVGYEEEGKLIVDYHEQLLEAGKDLQFFFHAGETNWYGSTDLNLLDAIILNSSRIGHGFALSKHPLLMDLARAKDIAVELCPISNQVLMLNRDPRNHPVVSLLAKDYPVVIGNDDPSAWGATGVSYDWYVAFMAMTPEDAGIEVLKKLAMDSIKYSAMSEEEKDEALDNWSLDWEMFLENVPSSKNK